MTEARPTVIDRAMAAVAPLPEGFGARTSRASLASATALTPPRAGSPVPAGGEVSGRGGYKGAHGDRRQTKNWGARLRSANGDTLGDQKTLIARSRDAAMNMPLATAAVERPVTFTVGTGLMAIPDLDADQLGITPDEALSLSSLIAADFDNYMSSTDPDAERTATGYGQQEIVMRGALESGDILALRVMPEDQPGRHSETAWKLIEADRVVSPANHKEGTKWGSEQVGRRARGAEKPTGNVIAGGVEVDSYGAPIAFHALKSAPNSFGLANIGRTEGDTVRIEAWGANTSLPSALLVMAKRRPEQFRGVSILAPVLEALRQVSDLTEAELFAAVLQGMIAIIYKSPEASAMPEPDYSGNGIVQGAEPWQRGGDKTPTDVRFESGTIMEIDSEAGAEMKAPGRPNPAFDPFFMAMAKQIAAAVEIPLEVLMLSFEASYSASRGALEVFYLTVRKRRAWLASHWCTPVYRAWLFEQVARGRYKLPGFLTNREKRERWSNVRFRGDGKISLDPAREAKALEIHEAHAWATGAEITAELNGGDYDANVKRREGEHARFMAAKLPIPNAKGGGSDPASAHEANADKPEEN